MPGSGVNLVTEGEVPGGSPAQGSLAPAPLPLTHRAPPSHQMKAAGPAVCAVPGWGSSFPGVLSLARIECTHARQDEYWSPGLSHLCQCRHVTIHMQNSIFKNILFGPGRIFGLQPLLSQRGLGVFVADNLPSE